MGRAHFLATLFSVALIPQEALVGLLLESYVLQDCASVESMSRLRSRSRSLQKVIQNPRFNDSFAKLTPIDREWIA